MDLTPDFIHAQTAYADRLAYATTHLHKEVWSSGPLLNAVPFDFERLGFAPGKPLSKRPTSTKNKYCYWLDEHAALLAIRKGIGIADQFYDEFFFTENSLSKSCLYGNTKILLNVTTRLFHNARISEIFMMGDLGSKHETFHYEQHELTKIRVEQWGADKIGIPYNAVFTYEGGNLREIVNEFDNGYQEVQYKVKE